MLGNNKHDEGIDDGKKSQWQSKLSLVEYVKAGFNSEQIQDDKVAIVL